MRNAAAAIQGALDIIAEQISDVADYRTYIRDITFKEGKIVSAAKELLMQSLYMRIIMITVKHFQQFRDTEYLH